MKQKNSLVWSIPVVGAIAFSWLAVIASAQAGEFRFSVTGSDSATGTDRQSAIDDAYDKASEQARTICAGGNGSVFRRPERTSSNCFTSGSGDNQTYSCMVTVRAECVSNGG